MNLWRWEISNVKGVKVSSSEAAFLSEKGCREQCELMKGVLEKEESQKYEVSVHSTEIFMPDAKRLPTKIYNYILRLELTERVKKYCTGCSYGAFEPTAHADGCLGDRKPIVDKFAKTCRVRISVMRLLEACRLMGKHFRDDNLVAYCTCADVILETDPVELRLEEKPDFEFAFQELADI